MVSPGAGLMVRAERYLALGLALVLGAVGVSRCRVDEDPHEPRSIRASGSVPQDTNSEGLPTLHGSGGVRGGDLESQRACPSRSQLVLRFAGHDVQGFVAAEVQNLRSGVRAVSMGYGGVDVDLTPGDLCLFQVLAIEGRSVPPHLFRAPPEGEPLVLPTIVLTVRDSVSGKPVPEASLAYLDLVPEESEYSVSHWPAWPAEFYSGQKMRRAPTWQRTAGEFDIPAALCGYVLRIDAPNYASALVRLPPGCVDGANFSVPLRPAGDLEVVVPSGIGRLGDSLYCQELGGVIGLMDLGFPGSTGRRFLRFPAGRFEIILGREDSDGGLVAVATDVCDVVAGESLSVTLRPQEENPDEEWLVIEIEAHVPTAWGERCTLSLVRIDSSAHYAASLGRLDWAGADQPLRFRSGLHPPGDYCVELAPIRVSSRLIPISKGSPRLIVSIPEPAPAIVSLRDATSGDAVSGAAVQISSEDPLTRSVGTAALTEERLRPGEYRGVVPRRGGWVRASRDRYLPHEQPIEIPDSDPLPPLEIELRRAGRVEVVVMDGERLSMGHLTVILSRVGEVQSADVEISCREGVGSSDFVEPGEYIVQSRPEMEGAAPRVVVRPWQTSVVVLTRRR